MLDWTDRHCRYLHRLYAPQARLYTEMVTTGAVLRGDAARHLDFDPAEHPVALQLGGSEPADLAAAARLGAQWGYDEINLNCGCPSERVQRGAFGACLMAEPGLVADCVKAMRDVVDVPVTVKHRIGLDHGDSYGFVRDFVGTLADAGCEVFIVHARNAVLKGLSPKENREIPPLRYEVARQLKADFPQLTLVLNGGIADVATSVAALQGESALDGVMIGREAWHRPRVLAEVAAAFWPDTAVLDDGEIVARMARYAERELARGTPLRCIVKPMLGLGNGRAGARAWRRLLSDTRKLAENDPGLIETAWREVRPERLAA
ncbi:tRNA dihydrouridine(20/20a) synthase DusA [Verticiella sediminum]